MAFYQEMINNVIEGILLEERKHNHLIVVGDNSSGKSYFLKRLVEELMPQNRIYFIDAVNRGFNIDKVLETAYDPKYNDSIVRTRIRDEYFNIKDSFAYASHDTENVEMIYSAYEEKVQKMFKQITGEKYTILYEESPRRIKFKKGEGILSSGYQALTRILLEVDYFYRTCVKQSRRRNAWIIIDEIDEFLSPRNARKLLPYLVKTYPTIKFIVSTHSSDVIISMKNTEIVVLKDKYSKILDSNDYTTQDSVLFLFEDVFKLSNIVREPDEKEERLRILLNHRMNNVWTDSDDKEMIALKSEELSNSQLLIMRQMEGWENDSIPGS